MTLFRENMFYKIPISYIESKPSVYSGQTIKFLDKSQVRMVVP